jgi:uncharacterized protein (DUF427 family)
MTSILAPSAATDRETGYYLLFEESPRRVRAFLGGTAVADSTRMMLLHEHGSFPIYYFPAGDVCGDLLEASGHTVADTHKGPATFWHIRVGARRVENAAWAFREPPAGTPDLSRHIALAWDAIDTWFEEDEQVYRHARDPYHRVDVLASSRHVRVVIDGVEVADTTRPRLLFETGLPTRYYIPKLDVRMGLLTSTARRTVCPYKGTASYWSARVGETVYENVAWSYTHPIVECSKIENLLAFFDERVDVEVDGERQERPRTQWS